MTLCALLATTLTTIAATTSGLVNVSFGFEPDYQPCILFASNMGSYIELNVNSKICDFSFGGEITVSCCALLLAISFMCKSSHGIGGKYETLFSLLQVLVLFVAAACGIFVTVGLSHTCTSRHGPTNATESAVNCDQLPITFHHGGAEVELNLVGPMSVVVFALWMGTALLLALLAARFLIMIWKCVREPTRYVIVKRVYPC